jgi:hypothetical protein
MEDKTRAKRDLSQKEIDLIGQLRRKPLIMARLQEILAVANASDGPLKTADQVEEMLIQEMRKLGNATMTEWANQAQQRVGQELQDKHPAVLKRKKKS